MPSTKENKQIVISIRVTKELRDKLIKDARKNKLTLSQFIRYILFSENDELHRK